AEHHSYRTLSVRHQADADAVVGPAYVARHSIRAWHLRYGAPKDATRLPQLTSADFPVRRPGLIPFIDEAPALSNQAFEPLVQQPLMEGLIRRVDLDVGEPCIVASPGKHSDAPRCQEEVAVLDNEHRHTIQITAKRVSNDHAGH